MPRIQHKRGTSANLASVNPTPLAGELVWDSSENAIKIGDGATAWTSLAYVTATPRSHVHDGSDITTGTVAYARLPVGSTASTVCAGDDARLSDARSPTAHKSSHSVGGSDALTPADIGAAPAASPTFTGTVTVPGLTSTGAIAADRSFLSSSVSGQMTFLGHNVRASATTANTAVVVNGGWVSSLIKAYFSEGITFHTSTTSYAAGDVYPLADTERMRIASNGRVGIGRNSPATALDVNGVITVSATAGSAGSYLPSVTFSGDANTGFGQVSGQSDSASVFTAGHERVRVKSTGAVRCVPLTGTDPTGDVGDIYYNSTMGTLRTYRGSSWVSVPPRPWDISNGVLTHEFSVAGQETQPAGIAFKPDGSKVYICGAVGDDVNEYDLATPWDISTASYLQNFSVSAKEGGPTAVAFRPNGLKMYVLGQSSDSVHEYDLSAAWDVTSATFLQSFSVSAKEGSPHGLVFKPDGLKFWICGAVSDNVHEYSMSAAWDISTSTFSQSLSIAAQDGNSTGLAFRPDGLRMYMTGWATDTTNEYILSTAWDISTAAFSQRLSVADTIPAGTTFSPDGTRLYVVGYSGQKILQYWIA